MKTLVAWDDPAEAELLDLYLNTDGSCAHLAPSATELLSCARAEDWDCVFLSLTFPTREQESFGLFGEVQTAHDLEHTLDQLFQASLGCTAGQGRHDDTSVVLVERQGD